MRLTIDRLQVKASLAKLEARDVRDELLKQYDAVHDRLEEIGEATEDHWEALKESVDAAWHSFKDRYDDVIARHREEGR